MVAILPPESRQEDCINKHMTSICHPQERRITDKDVHNQRKRKGEGSTGQWNKTENRCPYTNV